MKKVLFACTQNAGRSQTAEAFFNRHGPAEDWDIDDPAVLTR